MANEEKKITNILLDGETYIIEDENATAKLLEKADKSEIPTKLSDLQDDLSGDFGTKLDYAESTLSLLNKESEVLSSITIKSTPDLDNKTVSLNENGEIQAIGLFTVSGTHETTWSGSNAEYERDLASGLITPDTVCHINDDYTDIILNVPTATNESIGLCRPDGEILTVDDTGKMSLSEATDCCIEEGKYSEGAGGYRKYKNGFLEQFGVTTTNTDGITEVPLWKPFLNMHYHPQINIRDIGNFFVSTEVEAKDKFGVRVCDTNGEVKAVQINWECKGYWK